MEKKTENDMETGQVAHALIFKSHGPSPKVCSVGIQRWVTSGPMLKICPDLWKGPCTDGVGVECIQLTCCW